MVVIMGERHRHGYHSHAMKTRTAARPEAMATGVRACLDELQDLVRGRTAPLVVAL